MLHTAGLSYGFWVEAVRTASHVRNRSPSRVIDWKTPHEMLLSQAPDISYLRVFGCKAFTNVPKKKRNHKFESQSLEMIFVGYEPNSKGYRLWDKHTRTIKVSTDVAFDKSSFPNKPTSITPPVPNPSDQVPVQLPRPAPSSDDEDDVTPAPRPPTPKSPRFHRPPTPFASPTSSGPSSKGSSPVDKSPTYSPTEGSDHRDPTASPEGQMRNPNLFHRKPQLLPEDSTQVPVEFFNKPDNFSPRSSNQQTPLPSPPHATPPASLPTTPPIAPAPIDPPGAPEPERIIPRRSHPRGRGQQTRVPSLNLPSRSSSRTGRGQTTRYVDYVRSDTLDDDGNLDTTFLGAVLLPEEPATYREAIASPASTKWEEAMINKMESLKHNGIWEIMNLPPGHKVVQCKWVYRLKFNAAGEPYCYKAQLVAKGLTQVYGLDYEETFSPVACLDTMRTLLALATLEDWEIHQVDVKSAFLKGDLDEEIYIQQPEGFKMVSQEKKVCHLLKAIYGLKQASRQWHRKLHSALLDMGFSQLSADTSVYVCRQHRGITILMVYVDDIQIMGNSTAHIISVKQELGKRFDLTDLGELGYFLGIRVTRDHKHRTLELDQSKYIQDILIHFKMIDVTPTFTPLAAGTQLIKSTHPVEDNDLSYITQYQSLVGSLMYAMLGTHPDLSFTITKLSQFGSNPTEYYYKVAKHVLRYLPATQNYRLQFGLIDDNEITGYSDSD